MRLVCAQAVEITTLSASDVISFLILFAKVIICQQSAKKYSCLFVKFVFVITSVFVNKKNRLSSRQSILKTNYLKTNLLKQIKKISIFL